MWTSLDESSSASRIERDGRKALERMEEQISELGPECPRELLDAYDELERAVRNLR